MDDLIRKLRERNEDLERLAKQVQTLSEGHQTYAAIDTSTLSKFRKVQRASWKLHRAILDGCECPGEHLVWMTLSMNTGLRSAISQMTFLLCWQCLPQTHTEKFVQDLLWLVVDARDTSDSSPPDKRPEREDSCRVPPYQDTLQMNLKPLKNLCTQFKQYQYQNLQGRNRTESMEDVSHQQCSYEQPQSISLRDILGQAPSLPYGLPLDDRMHFAKDLSEAVLQYQST